MTQLTTEQLDRIDALVERYKAAEARYLEKKEDPYFSSGLKDARIQHEDMARGGDGGSSGSGLSGEGTIRGEFYPGYPTVFFRRICERMRWEWWK